MKAGKVMELLQISRMTLKRYREKGLLKATRLPTGQYDFDADTVYRLRNHNDVRITVVYARVSTYKQRRDLDNQVQELMDYSSVKGYNYRCYQDIASGISFEKRKEFFEMMDLILAGKVQRVVITHKDRLSRVGFEMFEYLFKKFDTEIEVISDETDEKTDEEELFEEIVNLLHCFSMRMYSHRREERDLIERNVIARKKVKKHDKKEKAGAKKQ